MTITELIAKLEAVKAEHGDLPVWCADGDAFGMFPMEDVSVEEAQGNIPIVVVIE